MKLQFLILLFFLGGCAEGVKTANDSQLASQANGPVIISQPQLIQAEEGDIVEMIIEVSNPEGISYQWYKDDLLLSDTNSALIIEGVLFSDQGVYHVVLTNDAGQTLSEDITLEVFSAETTEGPSITKQPVDTTVKLGTNAILSVKAVGSSVLKYQWFKDDEELPGKVFSELSFNPMTKEDFGVYKVKVYNEFGNILSNEVKLSSIREVFTVSVTEYTCNQSLCKFDWSTGNRICKLFGYNYVTALTSRTEASHNKICSWSGNQWDCGTCKGCKANETLSSVKCVLE